jgi:cytochrome c oxidase cbb3-type subunit 3
MDKYEDKILEDHDYDGIHEYDNPMPSWWKGMFVVTVIWSGIYCGGQLLGYIPTYEGDLHVAQGELEQLRLAAAAARPPLHIDEAMLLAAAKDDAKLSEGAMVYASTCASCHGDQGQGLIGPNLTDKYWIYGGEPMKILHTIQKGTPNGMPPWEAIVTPEQTVALVGHIQKLQGTNPPNPKEPQGELYEPAGTKPAEAPQQPMPDASAPAAPAKAPAPDPIK